NLADIVTEKAEENIAPWTFRLPIVPMTVDRQPINSVAIFILSIRISLVMLHVDGVVHCLRKATCDRLRDCKQTIQQFRAEERVVNEVVPHAVDVRIDHQRIHETEDQHYP